MIAEDASDTRDAIKKKDFRLKNTIGQIVIVDLDNVGETTLLRTLKDNPFDEHTSNYKELIIGNVKFTAFNSALRHTQGGHLWKDYISSCYRTEQKDNLLSGEGEDEGKFST